MLVGHTRSFDFRTKLANVEFPVDWFDLATNCMPRPQPNLQDSNVELLKFERIC